MNLNRANSFQLDWTTVLIYMALVLFGYFNIISASTGAEFTSYWDLSKPYGKQLVFIGIALVTIVFILALDTKFYERFSSIIYTVAILGLLGLFLFGKKVNGALSWYEIGGITLQPSEFAKFATALALAKYISDLQTNVKEIGHQIRASIIILIPAVLIIFQNDAGSTLVYIALIFVLYREGIPQKYLLIGFSFLIVALATLKFSALIVSVVTALILGFYYFLFKKKKKKYAILIWVLIASVGLSYATEWSFENSLKKHHQDRIGLWLRLETNPDKLEAMK
ncbi:MAG: rod shape-determining protein RodA, partial [Bacteroidota bacterium]|nr:rod shape-determining protein RodA [Bacteroidota bacterium]